MDNTHLTNDGKIKMYSIAPSQKWRGRGGGGWCTLSSSASVISVSTAFFLNVYLQYFAIICIVSAWRTQAVRDVWRFLHMRANDRRRAGSQCRHKCNDAYFFTQLKNIIPA